MKSINIKIKLSYESSNASIDVELSQFLHYMFWNIENMLPLKVLLNSLTILFSNPKLYKFFENYKIKNVIWKYIIKNELEKIQLLTEIWLVTC